MAEQSILTSIKKLLGIPEAYEAFDTDIVMHINSAFATLNQLGVGPDKPFFIDDKTSNWSEFLDGEDDIRSVRSWVYTSVRILFDPPQNSATLQAFKEQRDELTFRLLVAAEKVDSDG